MYLANSRWSYNSAIRQKERRKKGVPSAHQMLAGAVSCFEVVGVFIE
jgi:hypothetical protein